MTAVRNGLAALAAILLLLFLGHALAPTLAGYLPGKDAVAGALGLFACLLTLLYKLLDSALAALRLGSRRSPAYSRWVSVLAGASVLALVSGAFPVAATAVIEQALPLLKASPGTAVTVASPLNHLPLLQAAAVLVAALLIGAWIGRRHGLALGVAAAFALLGVAAMIAVEALAGLRSLRDAHEALRAFMHTPALATARTARLPLFLGVLLLALLGVALGGGRRVNRGAPPLVLGA